MVECAFSVPYNMNGLSFDVIIEILSNSMMKSSRANLSEGDELFTTDPTVNEKNRIYSCEEKEYFLKCVQEYHRKLFNTENDANTNDVLIVDSGKMNSYTGGDIDFGSRKKMELQLKYSNLVHTHDHLHPHGHLHDHLHHSDLR